MKKSILIACSLCFIVVAFAQAQVPPPQMVSLLNAFNDLYGTSATPVGQCSPCHSNPAVGQLNGYGSDFIALGGQGFQETLLKTVPQS